MTKSTAAEDPRRALELLDQVGQLQHRVQTTLRSFWFPMVVFGALALISAPITFLAGEAVGIFWALAGPGGGGLIARHYHLRERALGIESSALPYVSTSLGIMVGCFAAGFGGDMLDSEVISFVGPYVVVSLGFIVFARLDRAPAVAVVAAGLGALAIGLGAALDDARHTAAILGAAYGGVFLSTGWRYRRSDGVDP